MDSARFPAASDMILTPDYTATISKALGSFIQSRSATFACGGSVPVKLVDENGQSTATSTSNSPVIVRWDSTKSPTGTARLQFPIDHTDQMACAGLSNLIHDCQPASFGHKGQNVLDETYRKATKMDRSAFSVDFCPYEVGIIDTIAQILLPNTGRDANTTGVRAELYKLNVYAAPSGFFKSHVDTPRSSMQFGSLVVSLPCHHQGGQLIVRHAQHSKTFDWGATTRENSSPTVQWAAFYSDCEHEVLEVTEGYRVTLTYNLYHAPGVGNLAGNSVAMDFKSLPLFHYVQEALKKSEFMPYGGRLGVFCQHAYAHTHKDGAKALPAILKGSDMAVYTVFRSLGLNVKVRAILDTQSGRSESFENYLECHKENYMDEDDGEERADYEPPLFQTHTVVGSLGGYGATEIGGAEESLEEVVTAWSRDIMKIVWVNEPTHSGLDMVHLTYGNQAGIGTLYSFAAMLIKVPTAEERNAPGWSKDEPLQID